MLLTLISSSIFYYTIRSIEKSFNQLVEVEEPLEISLLESKTKLEEMYSHVLELSRRYNRQTLNLWMESGAALQARLEEIKGKDPGGEFSFIIDRVFKKLSEYKRTSEMIVDISNQQYKDMGELNAKIREIDNHLSDEIGSVESSKWTLDPLLRMKASIDKTFVSIDAYLATRDPRLRTEASEALSGFTLSMKDLKKRNLSAQSKNLLGKIGARFAEAALLAAEIIDREDTKQSLLDNLKDRRMEMDTLLTAHLLPKVRERLRVSMEEAGEKGARAKMLLYLAIAVSALAAFVAWKIVSRVMSSLSALSDGVMRIGRGDLDHKLAVGGKDELSSLAAAFNVMIQKRKNAEKALAVSGRKYRSLFENAHDGIIIFDPDDRLILDANEITSSRLGYTKEELLSLKVDDIIHGGFDPSTDTPFKEMKEGKSLIFERAHKRKDGSMMPVEISAKSFDYGGQMVVQAVIRDVTLRKEAERELKLASYVFKTAMEGVIVTDKDGVIQSVNPAFTRITGYEASEALGKKPSILRSAVNDDEFYSNMWETLAVSGQWCGEIWNRHKSGRIYPEWLTITAIKDFGGETIQYAAVFNDITDQKRNEEEIKFQAFHDPLTGLPNRLLFRDRLRHAIDKTQREGGHVAVLFMDLDNFKNINDTLGHDIGDLLLKGMSVRLIGCLREVDTVARIGGDEFVVILEGIQREEEASVAAKRMIDALSQPYSFKNESLYCTTSIGVSMYPADGSLADELIKNADLAMYHAKQMGKNNHQFFNSSMNEKVVRRVEMEKNLRHALEQDHLTCYYLPKIDVASGKIVGIEALVRWISDGRVVPGAEFIQVAEESNLILQIGEMVFPRACSLMAELRELGYDDLRLAVNISVRQLERGKLVEMVKDSLEKCRLDGKFLELEFTESAVLKDPELTVTTMRELRQYGVSMVIDDFGTGYSSLLHLRKFPLESLKIDRSFISEILSSQDASAIAKATISIGHNMGLKVIAEGVETVEQLEYLRSIGCDEAQGYLVSPALPSQELIEFLAAQKGKRKNKKKVKTTGA